MKIKLLLKKDDQIIKEIKDAPLPFRIGRTEDNDLVLPVPHISRHHAIIERVEHELFLTNLSERGQLLVEGENIQREKLEIPISFQIPPFEIDIELEITPLKFEVKPTEPLFETTEMPESFPLTLEEEEKEGPPSLSAEETRITKRRPKGKIIVLEGKSAHKGYDLIGDEIVMGRDPDCDISIEDPKISREHARILFKNQKFYLIDCESSNGTFINHKQIFGEKELRSSDQIQLGDAILQFAIYDEEAYSLTSREKGLSPDVTQSGLIPHWEAPPSRPTFFRYKKIFYASGLLITLFLIYFLINQKKAPPQRETAQEKKTEKRAETDELSRLTKSDREYVFEKMKVAKSFINNREYERAQIALEEVFAIAPSYSEARALIETLRSIFEQRRLASQKYEERLEEKRQEEEIKYHLSVALEHFNRQQWQKAIEEYDKILEIFPEHEEAQKKKIEVLQRFEKPEVKPEVSIAKKRNRQAEAWLAKGTTLAQQGEIQKALETWRKVLDLEGVNPAHYAKAEQFINFEKERLRQKYTPLLSQAFALIESKEYTQAEEVLQGILKEYPTYKEAKEALYKVQDALHQMARREYTEAIIDENVGRVDSAVKKFKWIIERTPASDEYHRKSKNKLKKYE